MAATAAATRRVAKLNTASQARVIEPDIELPGRMGDGQVLPDDLLLASAGLDEGVLDRDQMVVLSRQALASITTAGLQFESILMAGFGLEIMQADDYTDPRITYLLHELGEETRHSRLFARMLEQLDPPAPNPLDGWLVETVGRRVVDQIIHRPALLYTMVLAGEEIPDLLQKRAAEHPGTDPFVREVNRYHRQEEARHLAFARLRLPEVWESANLVDKTLVRFAAPAIIREMYENMIHAGVFAAAGLPGIPTWRAARNHPGRVEVRVAATRPVLAALIEAGAFERGKVPTPWRGLCAVDPDGEPLPGGPAAAA
ncbi:MAG TPA: diiron oxygenase [Acidimicrobiales bacterium]|nr:diiron oxygenase [Acidimicrobiales bacterium]